MKNIIGFLQSIKAVCPDIVVVENEPMEKHTTFRVGGPADVFVDIARDEIIDVIRLCNEYELPFLVIGNGSNLLVGDKGVRGVVISIGKRMKDITLETSLIRAEGGALLSAVSNFALQSGLTGLEFASGIPGSIGGAVFMNAGAYDGEIKDCITKARVIDVKSLCEEDISASDMDLSYRYSVFQKEEKIITEAEFFLNKGQIEQMRARMEKLALKRKDKQPVEYPSAGSTFKRPRDNFAGKLIQEAGLSGYRIGGACVSTKHAGFIINDKKATAEDIKRLIEYVKEQVYKNTGIELAPEVRFAGEF